MSGRIISTMLIGILSLVTLSGFGQTGKDTLRVLFVGNSYTYFENLPQVVSVLSEQTGTVLVTEKITIGGAKLSEHWRGARGLTTRNKINEGNYDIVVLQEWSLGTVSERDSAVMYLGLFSELVRRTGASPFYYLTWAREKVPQQQETISKVYRETAALNRAAVVPAGEAWAEARALRPDFRLFNPDGTHPSALGTYLTACVFVATITGELPETIPGVIAIKDAQGEDVILMMTDQLDVEFCRRVALKTTEKMK
ncbi:MAG: hypothetical protein MUE37_11630 [Bacteroidales bacterium]|jgi:hypothetical protein|nr:hypothetical protein [Bacteroidales bacterium]